MKIWFKLPCTKPKVVATECWRIHWGDSIICLVQCPRLRLTLDRGILLFGVPCMKPKVEANCFCWFLLYWRFRKTVFLWKLSLSRDFDSADRIVCERLTLSCFCLFLEADPFQGFLTLLGKLSPKRMNLYLLIN